MFSKKNRKNDFLYILFQREKHILFLEYNILGRASNTSFFLFSLNSLRDHLMLTNHTKINLNSKLSLNGASRTSILPCAPLLSCVRVFYHMEVFFSSIIMG
jgi:hypothetical protein